MVLRGAFCHFRSRHATAWNVVKCHFCFSFFLPRWWVVTSGLTSCWSPIQSLEKLKCVYYSARWLLLLGCLGHVRNLQYKLTEYQHFKNVVELKLCLSEISITNITILALSGGLWAMCRWAIQKWSWRLLSTKKIPRFLWRQTLLMLLTNRYLFGNWKNPNSFTQSIRAFV